MDAWEWRLGGWTYGSGGRVELSGNRRAGRWCWQCNAPLCWRAGQAVEGPGQERGSRQGLAVAREVLDGSRGLTETYPTKVTWGGEGPGGQGPLANRGHGPGKEEVTAGPSSRRGRVGWRVGLDTPEQEIVDYREREKASTQLPQVGSFSLSLSVRLHGHFARARLARSLHSLYRGV